MFCTNWFIFNRSHDFQIIWHYTVVHDVLCIICIVQFSKSYLCDSLSWVSFYIISQSILFVKHFFKFSKFIFVPDKKWCVLYVPHVLSIRSVPKRLVYNIIMDMSCQAFFPKILKFFWLFSKIPPNALFTSIQRSNIFLFYLQSTIFLFLKVTIFKSNASAKSCATLKFMPMLSLLWASEPRVMYFPPNSLYLL